MNWYPLWGLICVCLTAPALTAGEGKIKRYGEKIQKVEIELDVVEGNALITYNEEWKTTAKISYAEKKKIVAYRDDENGHCLLERITKRTEGDSGLSRVYRFSETALERVKAEELAGKKLLGFCGKYPITLLKEFSVKRRPEGRRTKRESDVVRGAESQLSHQEVSKRLLEDLAIAEGLVNSGVSKGVKRNVNDDRGHHPSASAKVDYHAQIRNGLPSGVHPMHPIDITSSVTIATGASHPVWSYPSSTGSHYPQNRTGTDHVIPHHSAHQNTTHHRAVTSHPSSSGQSFRTSGYYPPSSTSKTQQNAANYPPSSFSKTGYYPPSSTSKTQHLPAHYPPSSVSKPQQGQAHYPPSSSSHLPQPGPAYYPPSSTSKTHHNGTSGHGVHSGKPSVTAQYPSSSSHGYHPLYVPPSSTSKLHYPAAQNTSHPSFHHEPGRSTYAPQFPPSSTSKVYHQQYGTVRVPQYPPSSTSKVHHLTPNSHHVGHQDHTHGVAQYPPSSTSKIGTHYPAQFPPSSTSKHHYSHADSSYGSTPVLERPSARAQEPGSYPPSSTSKVHYSPHSHVMPAVQYYPPSSSSKVHYSPSSSSVHPHSQYPPSSTSKLHYSPSPAQIPQPPTDRTHMVGFPPSSTSKIHPQHYPPSSSSKQPESQHHPQHYPPSSSSKQHEGQHHPQHYPPSASSKQPQGQHQPAYYPPSSTTKLHQTPAGHQNFSTVKQPSSAYYPPSSTSKVHHSSTHHQDAGRVTATGRVSVTPGFAYYPPSMASRNLFAQGHHISPGHTVQQYPYYGPSSSSHHHNESSAGVPSSSGHGIYSQPQYPPSSTSKIHPPQQQNGSVPDHNIHPKPFHPMEHHPSSSGQHYPVHHNDTASRGYPQPAQGVYYPPSGHHPSSGGGYHPQYPPSSSSHHQQPQISSPTQFHQGIPPSSHAGVRPCQSSPRSLYSITTRTILTPNGAIQRPVSVKNNGEYPCGQLPGAVSYARYAPCSGTLTRDGQTVKPSCTANGNLRKSMRNAVPGLAVISNNQNIRSEQHQRGYSNAETQTELLHGHGHHISHHTSHFSKLQAENSTSTGDDATAPEYFEENGKAGKDVEVFERSEAEDRTTGKPVKYQEKEKETKQEEEEVKEGDVLEPGDRILGKDGYTILDGFRGRVVSVTGQIAKTRAETGNETRVTPPQEPEKKTNSGQFKYSSDLGRYVKENGEKNYSNCDGEPTFTCSEFLGSNGRAKICKPNPRRNPDGSPC